MSIPSSSESEDKASPTMERTSNFKKSLFETKSTVPFTISSSNFRGTLVKSLLDTFKCKYETNSLGKRDDNNRTVHIMEELIHTCF